MTTTVTEKQLAANRANASKSTGPRTPEGKSRAAQNARRHGLCIGAISITRLEDHSELENLRADAVAAYLPRTSQESFAVDRIALAQLQIMRAARVEAGLFMECLNTCLNDDNKTSIFRLHEQLIGDEQPRLEQNGTYALATGMELMARRGNVWSLFLRYQAQAERQYRRAVEEFERLKQLREEIPNEPISDPETIDPEAEMPSPNEPIAPSPHTTQAPDPRPPAPFSAPIPEGAPDKPAVP
jgi:hypothetical protein